MALWDGREVKEYQKPRFRPRPWGSITAGWSWQPSDPPFQKMTRIHALQDFLGTLRHKAFVCSIELIYYRFLWECQLACFPFCFSTRVGQDVALHFDIDPNWLFMYLRSVKPGKFIPNPAVKTWTIWQRKKASCHHTELQMQWPGQTLEYWCEVTTLHFLTLSIRPTSMHTQLLSTWFEV